MDTIKFWHKLGQVNSYIQRRWSIPRIHKHYESNFDFPYLISFPRTGSHWLRILLEEYTNQPLLDMSFHKHKSSQYLLCHTHDLDLSVNRKKVIYLFRNPVSVVFSQLKYHNQPLEIQYVNFWASQYACHLCHWLFLEKSTQSKLLVRYEDFKQDTVGAFKVVCTYLGLEFQEAKITSVILQNTKKQVSNKTQHDTKVINTEIDYEAQRTQFITQYEELICKIISFHSRAMLNDDRLLDFIEKNQTI